MIGVPHDLRCETAANDFGDQTDSHQSRRKSQYDAGNLV